MLQFNFDELKKKLEKGEVHEQIMQEYIAMKGIYLSSIEKILIKEGTTKEDKTTWLEIEGTTDTNKTIKCKSAITKKNGDRFFKSVLLDSVMWFLCKETPEFKFIKNTKNQKVSEITNIKPNTKVHLAVDAEKSIWKDEESGVEKPITNLILRAILNEKLQNMEEEFKGDLSNSFYSKLLPTLKNGMAYNAVGQEDLWNLLKNGATSDTDSSKKDTNEEFDEIDGSEDVPF
jgi:hypothetical protein